MADQLVGLLEALLSPDNTSRRQAEAIFNEQVNTNSPGVAEALLQVLSNTAVQAPIRSLAAVLLRRIVDVRGSIWRTVPDNVRGPLRSALLSTYEHESDPSVLRKLCHALAKASTDWPELLHGVVNNLSQQDPSNFARHATAFYLLEQMAEFSPELPKAGASLLPLFNKALQETTHPQIRMAAVRAVMSLITNVAEEADAMPLQPLVPAMLAAICLTLQAQDDLAAKEMFELLAEVAEAAPHFFLQEKDLHQVLGLTMQVAGNANFDVNTRGSAVEVMLTCCAAAPATMRRVPGFAEQFLRLCMELGCVIVEDQREWEQEMNFVEWGSTEDEEESLVAEDAIARLLESLQGKTMMPVASTLLPAWLQDPDWRKRRVGLLVMTYMTEQCAKSVKPRLSHTLQTALTFIKDSHPRVAAQALSCLVALCEAFPNQAQNTSHTGAVPLLATVIADTQRPVRVRGMACAALVSFCGNDCPQEAMDPYLDHVLGALVTCLQPDIPPQAQEKALEALSGLADLAQDSFGSHYQSFMPGLKGILQSPAAAQMPTLRDQAMKAVGYVGAAVGRETFLPDAREVMAVLATELQHAQPGTLSIEHVFPAMGLVCKALKEDFVAYLPLLIPFLQHTIATPIDFSVEDVDDDTNESSGDVQKMGVLDSAVVDVRGFGKKRFSVNTAAILDQEAALEVLSTYVVALKHHFMPYVELLGPLVVPLVQCRLSENVRTAAAVTLAGFFEAAVAAVQAGIRPDSMAQQLVVQYLPRIIEQLLKEAQSDARVSFSEAIRDILRACAESGGIDEATGMWRPARIKLSSGDSRSTVQVLIRLIVESIQRRAEFETKFETNDQLEEDDREALCDSLTQEADLLRGLTDSLGYLLKAERAAFIPVMDTDLMPLLKALLGEDGQAPANFVMNAICLLDDCIEVLIQSWERTEMPPEGDEEEEDGDMITLRQACVYGITQVTKHAPEFMDQVAGSYSVLARLGKILQRPDRNEEHLRSITENAVSALGALCQGVLQKRLQVELGADMADLIRLWLSHLPLYDDLIEARVVHRQLCEMLEQCGAAMVGKSYANAPLLVAAITSILQRGHSSLHDDEENIIDKATFHRLGGLLQHLQQSMPTEVWQAVWANLTVQQQNAMQLVVTPN